MPESIAEANEVTDARADDAGNVGADLQQGNTSDDDGIVLDEYFEPNPGLPVTHAGIDTGKDELPPVTRILTRAIPLIAGGDPVQAYPANRKRKSVRIVGRSTTATDKFRIASDKADIYGAGLIPVAEVWGIDNQHTGEIWVYCGSGDAAGSITVNVEQVTE